MRIATIIVRLLMALMFLSASVVYFLDLAPPQPPMQGNAKVFMDGLNASGYMMNLVKAIELICGLAFLSGRFVALANIVLLPVTVNILMVHTLLVPDGMPIAIAVFAAHLFLIYAYRQKYIPLFEPK